MQEKINAANLIIINFMYYLVLLTILIANAKTFPIDSTKLHT